MCYVDIILKSSGAWGARLIFGRGMMSASVSLILGSKMKQVMKQGKHVENAHKYLEEISKMGGYTKVLKKFAYRPSLSTLDEASTDPRTYFYLRSYLTVQSRPPIALIPTWVSNISVNKEVWLRTNSTPEVQKITGLSDEDYVYSMPENVNNVEPTVIADSLFGMRAMICSAPDESAWFDKETQAVFLSSCHFLAWSITDPNALDHPELSLLYYPAIKEFLWFTSKTIHLLNNTDADTKKALKMYPVLQQAKDMLFHALSTNGMDIIRESVIRDPKQSSWCAWDGFLGNADTVLGYSIQLHSDRVFETACCCNAMLCTWTETMDGQVHWIKDTPKDIIDMVAGGVDFLYDNIMEVSASKKMCAAASVDTKDDSLFAWFFPSNVSQTLMGKELDPNRDALPADSNLFAAMKGPVEESDYQNMLKQKWFGQSPPVGAFQGFNTYPSMRFYSSPVYTELCTAEALARYCVLKESE